MDKVKNMDSAQTKDLSFKNSVIFVKGWNVVYPSAGESCPACACESPPWHAEENELTELSEPIEYNCKWHPFYISVKFKGKSGVVMINSAQVKYVFLKLLRLLETSESLKI